MYVKVIRRMDFFFYIAGIQYRIDTETSTVYIHHDGNRKTEYVLTSWDNANTAWTTLSDIIRIGILDV